MFLGSPTDQAITVLPVQTEEETVAVLVLKDSHDGANSGPFRTETAEAVAAQLGIAVRAKRAYDRVLQLSEAKDQFIAAVSHELRTPLTSIVGFAQVIAATAAGLSGEQREFLEKVGQESRSLATIIDNLTIAGRTDIAAVGVAIKEIALSSVVSDVIGEMEGNEIQIRAESGEGIHAMGDPERVKLILRNLVDNAVRHGTRVNVSCTTKSGVASLQVANRGEPISGRDRAVMFEPFVSFNTDPGQPRRMGIGLPVSRSLARLMDGDVTYQHQEGENVFDLSLPLATTSVSDGDRAFDLQPT
jgi:signal transduction histidine kinase